MNTPEEFAIPPADWTEVEASIRALVNPPEGAVSQPDDALKECLDQVRFARAAELAASGRRADAESVLSPHGRISLIPRELDLLARISAQQGNYDRACRLWETALQRSPKNSTYLSGIERAKVGGPVPAASPVVAPAASVEVRKQPVLAYVLIVLILVVGAAWFLLQQGAFPFGQNAGAPTASTSSAQTALASQSIQPDEPEAVKEAVTSIAPAPVETPAPEPSPTLAPATPRPVISTKQPGPQRREAVTVVKPTGSTPDRAPAQERE